MRDLCVFDLDGTLIAHDSFGRLVRNNLARHPQLILAGLARKAGLFSRAGFAAMAHRSLISRLDAAELQVIADDITANVIPARRKRIEDWRAQGAFLVLMSASPAEYVTLAGRALGFDAAYGSQLQNTGYLHLYGGMKLDFLTRHYPAGAWRRAYAISDSASDEVLLAEFEVAERV